VVNEDHPTQPNLVGRVEHLAHLGALITDFNLIKPGALHKANGGYLVLEARKVLLNPFAWEDLKRALRAREVRVESPGQSMGMLQTVTIEPEPIPLDLKVVLIGEPMLYYSLAHQDPDFTQLFKVAADFDYRMDRSAAHEIGLARLVAGLVRAESLRHLDAPAVARLIEHASRLAEDGEKLSTHRASIADLVRESDHWAAQGNAPLVGAAHVQQAIDQHGYRLDRVREHVLEEIERGTVLIDTEGEAVGQVNGLVVMELGNFAFGRPSRISCRVHLGRGDLIDIEREVDLGGPLHSKGVMILSSFLADRFAQDQPMNLSASLVFEQSYGEVEGDSASSAELYCLLSALAEAPIRQSFAVTGSVNQFGQVQAIGGVNEKIEGFFDVCRARGLTGEHGVLIPASNVAHLMLRPDVVRACSQGLFRIHAVETVDQGIELLTGVPAGEVGEDGEYPSGSINRRVAARLSLFSRRIRQFMQEAPAGRRERD
jgi:predicted ATP-dependent protease